MRICIDARSLREVTTGLGTYARSLVTHLGLIDRANQYLILRRSASPGPIVTQANFTEVRVPWGIYSAHNVLWGSRLINPLAADVYHALFHFVPYGVSARSVVTTLHDLIWIEHRSLAYEDWVRRWLKCGIAAPLIRHAVRRADQVITVSNATRSAAIAGLGVDARKVATIHLGVEPLFFRRPDLRLVPPSLQDQRFIFSLGNSLPYKNGERLVRAFAVLAKDHADLRLLMVGRGDGFLGLDRLARRLGVSGRVQFSEQLCFGAVHACFCAAQLFAFPSLVEGFGLPILEAMASGCPVVTSDRSAPAEVASTAAELVDPTDVMSIADGMRRLLENPVRRRQLARLGRQRAMRFTWDRAAAQTLEVYRKIAATRAGGVQT